MENGHGKGSQREGEDRLPGGTNYLGRYEEQTVWSNLGLNLEQISREHWAQDVKIYFVMRKGCPLLPDPARA
jgi:hypothetical protein